MGVDRDMKMAGRGIAVTWRHGDVASSLFSAPSLPQSPSLPASPPPRLPASQLPSLPASQPPRLPASQLPRLPASQLPSLLARLALSLVLLGMALGLGWYALCTNRIAAIDPEFVRQSRSARAFPEAWLLRGSLAYYVDLDPAGAAECFRQAIAMQPSLVEAWLALARVELTQGRADAARLILDTLAPHIDHVSTWKWQELLLANDLQDETHFADSFNFILSRLPERRSEVWYLALNFWGSWPGIFPHVGPEGRIAYLNELMREKEIDVALSLWKTLEKDHDPPEKALALRFCQFLIDQKRLRDANEVWKGSKENGLSGGYVYDGDFEQEPSNTAFGWRFASNPEVVVERTSEAPFAGGYCLHLHFGGTSNVNFSLASQIIPVEPGRNYLLRFAQKSRNLTTDQGVFIEVSGYQCEGLRVQSRAITGSKVWTREEVDVPVPDGCEAVYVQIRRNESLKFDNKIAGDYWLDAVVLSLWPEARAWLIPNRRPSSAGLENDLS